jgi:VWFA-related protein
MFARWRSSAAVSLSLTVLFLTVGTPTPARAVAQDENVTAPVFQGRHEVNIGSVEVRVVDREGRPIHGLRLEEFVLVVNGEPREITHFAEFGRPAEKTVSEETVKIAEPTAVAANGISIQGRDTRFLVIFVDCRNLSIFNRTLVLNRAEEFVRTNVRPPGLAMVVTNDTYLRVVCPPTDDPEAVLRALGEFKGVGMVPGNIQNLIRTAQDQIYELRRRGASEIVRDQAMAVARMTAGQVDQTLVRTVDSMKTLFRSISGLEGRKAVLYISDGLPMTSGEELFRLVNALWRYPRALNELPSLQRGPLHEQLANHAIAANITLHTIDARGLMSENTTSAGDRFQAPAGLGWTKIRNYQDSLLYLSRETGGLAVVNSNEFGMGLEEIGTAISSYYSLAFALEPPARDRLHSVDITLPDHPDYQLRYRRELVERSAMTRVSDRTMAGLLADPANNRLEIGVVVGAPVPNDGKISTAPLKVLLPLSSLLRVPDGEVSIARVSTFLVAGNEDGRSEMEHMSHILRIPADAPDALSLVFEIKLRKGHNRISAGVLDEQTGETGFAVTEIDVVR